MSRNIYVMQPYRVGSKNGKSLVILIPARIVKEFNINTSTVFMLRKNKEKKTITLETIHELNEQMMLIEGTKDEPTPSEVN